MTTASRLLSVLVVVALLSLGALGPRAAGAQSQTPPSAEPTPPAPAPPELTRMPMMPAPPSADEYEGAYQAGAVVATMFSVPGRVVLCTAGSALSLVTMVLTVGTGYAAAKSVFEEGCIGKWVVTSDDLREANRRSSMGVTYP